jgi:hypothetical protein
MNILSRLFRSESFSENDALNSGLSFSMEFGENFRMPIHDRLKRKYSHLTSEELEKYDSICQKARDDGYQFISDKLMKLYDVGEYIKQRELSDAFRAFISMQYPWMSEKNRKELLNQGLYFAWKDGLNSCIK